MEESNRTLVLEAPYAGIIPRGWHVLERSERDFEKAGRILVPNLNDWTQTGKVLARLANKYDYEKIGQGRLTTDALIAMSAARLWITGLPDNTSRNSLRQLTPEWRVLKIQQGLDEPAPRPGRITAIDLELRS